MRGRRQRGLVEDALDGRVRALARRAAGAVGHRDEMRAQAAQAARSTPTASSPSPRSSAGRTRTRRAMRPRPSHEPAEAAGAASFITRPPCRPAITHARIAREPERHRDLAVGAVLRRELLCMRDVEAGGGEPLRHRLGREAEPAMGMLVAQEFEIVRREVDHQQPAGRAQHARRFADRARAVVEEVQHLMDDDDVEGIAAAAADRRCRPAARCNGAGRRGRAARARAAACRATGRCRARARSPGRTARACGRCRCRDRAASGTACRRAPRRSPASTASSATCSLRMRSHSAACARK